MYVCCVPSGLMEDVKKLLAGSTNYNADARNANDFFLLATKPPVDQLNGLVWGCLAGSHFGRLRSVCVV